MLALAHALNMIEEKWHLRNGDAAAFGIAAVISKTLFAPLI